MRSRPLEAIRARLRRRQRVAADSAPPPSARPQAGTGEEPAGSAAYYREQAEALAAELEAITRSESFRVGHAIVRTLRAPFGRRRPRGGRGDGRLRRAVSSLLSGDRAPQREPLAIPAGDHLLGPLNEKPSTAMFVLWAVDDDQLASLTAEVARLQLMLRDFKPLFVTDSDFWAPFSEYGYWFEHIPPFEQWSRHNDPTEWPGYVSERIGSIIATYEPARVVVYEGGPAGEALRRGVLNSVIGRSVRATEKAALPPQTRRNPD